MPEPVPEGAATDELGEAGVGHPQVDRGLVAALRYRTDEVQWGRVLTAGLQSPDACSAFATAVLEATVRTNSSGAARTLLPVPDDVVCLDENVLRGRPTKRQAAKAANGRVDLTFSSRTKRTWRLHIELKIDHKLTQEQVSTYARDAPVIAVVRDPAVIAVNPETPNWLGAVGWVEIIGALRALPLPASEIPVWQQILDVMTADGDLTHERLLSDDARAAGEVVTAAAEAVLDHATKRLSRQAGVPISRLRTVARVRVYPPTPRSTWAEMSLNFTGVTWWWVALRGVYSPAPEVFVWFYPSGDRASMRSARDAATALKRAGRPYEQFTNGYRWRDFHRELRNASGETFAMWFCNELDVMRKAGVYANETCLKDLRKL